MSIEELDQQQAAIAALVLESKERYPGHLPGSIDPSVEPHVELSAPTEWRALGELAIVHPHAA